LVEPPDISSVMLSIEQLLDESVGTEGYIIKGSKNSYGEDVRQDLSKIDFEKLRKRFEKSRKHTEAEKLRSILQAKIGKMVQLNRSRFDYAERLQKMIDDYNSGSINIDELYNKLIDTMQSLDEEDKRSIKEGLTEEELAVFDLLTKPEMKLTKKEEQQVKKVARDLLNTLKAEKLVLDWRKRQQSRAAVKVAIEEVLDKLPDCYAEDIFNRKVGSVYEHIYESYYGAGKSLYTAAN
jgi:type I restriction enzyme R subunit